MNLYFVFNEYKTENDFRIVELFLDNYKRNIAFIVPHNLFTEECTDYARLLFVEKIYKYIFDMIKVQYNGECEKPYKESELHYLMDIAPTILSMLTVYGKVNSEVFSNIPKWLKHEAPRYDYDNRIVEAVLHDNDITYLFNDYTIVSIIKDIYDPVSKKRVDNND
jgi:hypothetical protein